jgi:hypothetical protein
MHTVTSNDKEFIVISYSMSNNVRERGHDLLFWQQFCTFFELEVAYGAGKCKVAVNTTKIHEAPSSAYACLFTYKVV